MRFHDRVLTLDLLGWVEVLPIVYPPKPQVMGGLCESHSPKRVMMVVEFLLGNHVNIVDTVALEVYEWLCQYSWRHGIFQ